MKNKVFRAFVFILSVILILTAATSCKKNDPADNNEEGNNNMSNEEIYNETIKKYADNKNPIAVIVMESGETIVFEMYPEIAENTVKNFISLANKGFYDGIIFHRVIANFMIQTGDPLGNGTGGPGYQIFGEFSNNDHQNDLAHTPGVVSMARQGNRYYPSLAYNTAGSQFFICVSDQPGLDGDYAAFGKVIDGMDAVYAISKTATDASDKPLVDQRMDYVRVDTHGTQFGEPETIAE